MIQGTISILGLKLWGKLLFSTTLFEIDVNMDPIHWAGKCSTALSF